MCICTHTCVCVHVNYSLSCVLGCTTKRKVPILTVNVETIFNPDCTYGFVFNVSLEYDPIVLEEVSVLKVQVIDSDMRKLLGIQSYLAPFNIVRKCVYCSYVCTYIPVLLNSSERNGIWYLHIWTSLMNQTLFLRVSLAIRVDKHPLERSGVHTSTTNIVCSTYICTDFVCTVLLIGVEWLKGKLIGFNRCESLHKISLSLTMTRVCSNYCVCDISCTYWIQSTSLWVTQSQATK